MMIESCAIHINMYNWVLLFIGENEKIKYIQKLLK